MKKLLLSIAKTIAKLPLPKALALGRALGWIYGNIVRYHREDAIDALTRAFPDKNDQEIQVIVKQMYANLGMNMIELTRLAGFSAEVFSEDYIKIHGLEHVEAALKRNKGALILTGHIGSWDLACTVTPRVGYDLTVITKALKQEALNEVWQDIREKFGVKFVPAHNSYRACLKVLRKNELVGFILDQNMIDKEGIFVNFFDRPACTTPGLAFMSAQSKAPVVPIFIKRMPDGTHEAYIQPLIEPPPNRKPEAIQEATQVYTKILEDYIRENPTDWIWLHRRWRTQPPQPIDSEGRPDAALSYLRQVRVETKTLSIGIIAEIVWLSRVQGDPQAAAYDCITFAEDAYAARQDDLALEACSGAVFLDQAGRFEITASPEKTKRLIRLYEEVALHTFPAQQEIPRPASSKRKRVALITGNLVDHVVAYTRLVLNMCRYIDRTAYEVFVYSTENLTERENPLFPFGLENGGSEEGGAATIAQLKQWSVPVYLAPRTLGNTETARVMMEQLAHDEIDVAIFQTGIASPIDWLVARLAPISVKAGIHIGSSPFNTGFDYYFFDNPANIERENTHWTADMGERVLLSSGVDIDRMQQAPVLPRKELGIPEGAVLIGTVSNRLDERLSHQYCELIASVLADHPTGYFMGIGIPPSEETLAAFSAHGVRERIRFPGPVSLPAAALKMLDVYACEFPVGGSESVKEAIACGIPVVAMPWSNAHAECAAANIVGEVYAIGVQDIAGYRRRLIEWIEQSEVRQQVGREMAERAQEQYSLKEYVQTLMSYIL